MSDLQKQSKLHANVPPDDLAHTSLVPAEHHEHDSRTMFAIAMAGIAALFVLSVAMAVSQISTGVKTASNGKLAPITTPERTDSGGGHRS